jgi:hypothetical protein
MLTVYFERQAFFHFVFLWRHHNPMGMHELKSVAEVARA